MKIQELMSKPAVTCRPTDTLNTAAQLMWEHDCGAIPIVGDDGSIVGLVTDRDVCMAAYIQGRPLHAIPVNNAMAKEVFSCHGNDPLEAAERLMREKQIRRIPVVDGDNRPLGLLSLNDIARYAASAGQKNGLERELTATLAAISEPRPSPSTPRTSPRPRPPEAQLRASM